ncbi:MAG: dephospho-CoA kinase [Planctomycetaceae bacterium]
MSQRGVPIVGLVGGVGAGKSTLSAWLSRHCRVAILDADAAGHAVLCRPDVVVALKREFGSTIIDEQGAIHRPSLASRVFGESPEQRSARRRLESIVHPLIRRELETQIAGRKSQGDCDLIMLDAAVMLESGWSELCNAVVYIDVPRAVRVSRVQHSRGWCEEDLDRREISQWSLDRKRAAADFVVDNSGAVEVAGQALYDFLSSRFPHLLDCSPPANRVTTIPHSV